MVRTPALIALTAALLAGGACAATNDDAMRKLASTSG